MSTIYLPVVQKPPIEFLVDCGADGGYIDATGQGWLADRPYTEGSWGYEGDSLIWSTPREISNTSDPHLYQTLRYAYGSFGYRFDVPNGTYKVELHFAELYHNSSGRRIFDVIIEGQTVLDNYDVFAAAGGWLRARVETREVTVSDGDLSVVFARGPVDYPIINALGVTKIS